MTSLNDFSASLPELNKNSEEYNNIYYNYLREFIFRRQMFSPSAVSVYKIYNEETSLSFNKVAARKYAEFGSVGLLTLFHGPQFQEGCYLSLDANKCIEHRDNMVCFMDTLNRFGDCAQKDMHVFICDILVGNMYQKDPEYYAPNRCLLTEQYDTVCDYGNRKLFKLDSEDIFFKYLVVFQPDLNPRLSDPLNRIFQADDTNPYFFYQDINPEEFREQHNISSMCQILSVKKICNRFLEEKYREQKAAYGQSAEELVVYHGTTFECADQIAKTNLNWRKASYGKYGWGVHFTKVCPYAQYFPLSNTQCKINMDTILGPKQCLIQFHMLYDCTKVYQVTEADVYNGCLKDMTSPPDGTSTIKVGEHKFVKFEDNEFLPQYKIVFKK